MTVADALARATSRITPFDARILLEEACGLTGAHFLAHPETQLESPIAERFDGMVARREHGEPVAYITGHAGFYGRTFSVDRRVLVPRPETEHLIEAVLDYVRGLPVPLVRVADIGTGSGVIAISLAAEDERIEVVATDVSAEALAVAGDNAHRLGVAQRVAFAHGDLLEPLRGLGCFDVVVANLPYVPSADVPAVPHPVGYEPRVAVDGGADGLVLYRKLLDGAGPVIGPGGALFLEAAPGTIDALAEAAESVFPDAGIEIGCDYGGLERYVAVIF